MRLSDAMFLILLIGSYAFFAGLVAGHQGWISP